MAHGEAHQHLNQKERSKGPEGLEVPGVERRHPAEEPDEEKDSCRGAHRPFVKYWRRDTRDSLAKGRFVVGFGGVGHECDYTRGGIRESWEFRPD